MHAPVVSPAARRALRWAPAPLSGVVALSAALSFRGARLSEAVLRDPRAVPTEWTSSGGVGGAHFSPLAEISRENVHRLRVAWVYRTGDVSSGTSGISATSFQATPIMVDGTLYFSTPFSRVVALDAERGTERWVFDPRVDRSAARRSYVTSPRCRDVAGRDSDREGVPAPHLRGDGRRATDRAGWPHGRAMQRVRHARASRSSCWCARARG